MRLCPEIDLANSLRPILGKGAEREVERDSGRQSRTAAEILRRFFSASAEERRELILLADEVGLGKTFVALAVAVSVLDAIRKGEAPSDLPSYKPAVLILTPKSGALYNKWIREANNFKTNCAKHGHDLDWLTIVTPREGKDSKRGNMIDLTRALRGATQQAPRIVIAKSRFVGTALDGRDDWRRRALDAIFDSFKIPSHERTRWCRLALGSGSQTEEPALRDRRKAEVLWAWTREYWPDLRTDYVKVLESSGWRERLEEYLDARNENKFAAVLDGLTRKALARSWPKLPLIVIDEIHNLKNDTTVRAALEDVLEDSTSRLLGLSATPFQLNHDELIRVLGLRSILRVSTERRQDLDGAVEKLESAMKESKERGGSLKSAWLALRPEDGAAVVEAWKHLDAKGQEESRAVIAKLDNVRVARAMDRAQEMGVGVRRLEKLLRPFVIRHLRPNGYRQYWVGRNAPEGSGGSKDFSWAPGFEPKRDEELVHYLLMRAVSLWKDGSGRAGLGAELTGSYRHLIETSATWRHFSRGQGDPRLAKYVSVLEKAIGKKDSDLEHPKISRVAEQALAAFKKGQKTLVFCVYVKTAAAVRDEVRRKVAEFLEAKKAAVFGDADKFENFRRRFANRREQLFSLIQDHPLLGKNADGIGVPEDLRLGREALDQVAALLAHYGVAADLKKRDLRKVLAAIEHVAVTAWETNPAGRAWLDSRLPNDVGVHPSKDDSVNRWRSLMSSASWVGQRGKEMAYKCSDPEADEDAHDADLDDGEERGGHPGDAAQVFWWKKRLTAQSMALDFSMYFKKGILPAPKDVRHMPLLPLHHSEKLERLSPETRAAAGQAFRRIMMSEEFLLRFLTEVKKETEDRWRPHIAERYREPLEGQAESLYDRFSEYLDSLDRAAHSEDQLASYHDASGNRNVVQMVKGGMKDPERYFLGFNTPYRPEILITTSVGQEGIDLHKECRNVIHHDLCWNPATLEQRTGRVDRIGSKVEREGARLDVQVPYLAGTYDERMFEELYARQQLFELTMGGDFKVEGRIADPDVEKAKRRVAGIGTEDEDVALEGERVGSTIIPLPEGLIEFLRVDLAVDGDSRHQ